MKRLFGCVFLLTAVLPAQSMDTTLLALKDPQAPRKALSHQLSGEMLAQAKSNQSPSQYSVQRFSEDLTTALLGKDITTVRAAALRKSITGVLSGKGSTFLPANGLYETLKACGIEDRTIQSILDRFREIGQQVRQGPDDLPLQKFK
jgi:hypothetical protein